MGGSCNSRWIRCHPPVRGSGTTDSCDPICPPLNGHTLMPFPLRTFPAVSLVLTIVAGTLTFGCSKAGGDTRAMVAAAPTVATTEVQLRPIAQHLTVSSELVPFQEIDVYAKEAGYVKELSVDYGSRVRQGQVMAVLEIPELEAQLKEDEAMIKARTDEVTRAGEEVARAKAQHDVTDLQYNRLNGVAKTKPGLVAQQEVDDAQGKDLA